LTGGALDVQRDPGAGELPRGGSGRAVIEQLERGVQAALVVARVIAQPKRGLMREVADQVASPQLDSIEAELPGGVVDQALQQIGRVRSPRS